MKIGVSYFGVQDPRWVKADLYNIRQNFDFVVLPMSETDVRFQVERFKDTVATAKDMGLETIVSPWGVAGVFGGEGISAISHHCPYSCHVEKVMSSWIKAAREISPDSIMWDEPRGTCCNIDDFMETWIDIAGIHGFLSEIYVNYPSFAYYPSRHSLEIIKTLWFDTYNAKNSKEVEAIIKNALLVRTDEMEVALWIRAFRLQSAADTKYHAYTIEAAAAAGIDKVALWGYNGSRSVGVLQSDPQTWDILLDSVKKVRRKDT